MGPLCIMVSVVVASFAGPMLMVWPVVTYAFLSAIAIVSEPTTCPCRADAQAASGTRSRDAIVMLTNKNEFGQTRQALQALYKHFNKCFRKTVLLFHPGDISPEMQAVVTKQHPQVHFHLLNAGSKYWQVPAGVGTGKGPAWFWSYRSARWNYRMVFEYLEGLGYEWLMRLDLDVRMASCLDYDPFALLEAGNRSLGHRLEGRADPAGARALTEVLGRHLGRQGLVPPPRLLAHFQGRVPKPGAWDRWACCEGWVVARISRWRAADVQGWLEAVEAAAAARRAPFPHVPVQGLAQLLCLDEHEVQRFSDWSLLQPRVVTVAPRSLLPRALALLVPQGHDWVGGALDKKDLPRLTSEFGWVSKYVVGRLSRREFWWLR